MHLTQAFGKALHGIGPGFAALLLALVAPAVAWSAYPEQPIRLIVPYPAGGAADFMARSLAQKLAERLGKPVVLDNRGGAGGTIAAEAVASAPPDGYTLLFATMGTLAINPQLYAKLRYDPVKDFAPISLTHATPRVLVVHPSVKATTVKELIALAKASPGTLTFGSAGNGSSSHLSGELFKSMAGIDITHVPYRGSGPAATDLLGGRISMIFDSIAVYKDYITIGKVRALGVTSPKRSESLPGIPSIAEAGLTGFDISNWLGVVAPARTPPEIVTRLNAEIRVVMADAELKKQLLAVGIEPLYSTPKAFAGVIRTELAKWAAVVKASGARID
ncbi:MAG: tripartite tricarboxylate transporter substrate binding protein [Betaproteobacteria bacterium]|nr:tripartite tricarboxylate transporter substrate binding protein [Betaproteobacteria bacterium]